MIGGRPSNRNVARNLAYTQQWLARLSPARPTGLTAVESTQSPPAPAPDLPTTGAPAAYVITFIGYETGSRVCLSIEDVASRAVAKHTLKQNEPRLVRLLLRLAAITGVDDTNQLLERCRHGFRVWPDDVRCIWRERDLRSAAYSTVYVRTGNQVAKHRVKHGSPQAAEFERQARALAAQEDK